MKMICNERRFTIDPFSSDWDELEQTTNNEMMHNILYRSLIDDQRLNHVAMIDIFNRPGDAKYMGMDNPSIAINYFYNADCQEVISLSTFPELRIFRSGIESIASAIAKIARCFESVYRGLVMPIDFIKCNIHSTSQRNGYVFDDGSLIYRDPLCLVSWSHSGNKWASIYSAVHREKIY